MKHVKQEMRGEANRIAQGSIKDEVQKHKQKEVKHEVKSEVLVKQHLKKEVKEEDPGKVKHEVKKEVKLEVKTEARLLCHVPGSLFDDWIRGLLGWRMVKLEGMPLISNPQLLNSTFEDVGLGEIPRPGYSA